MTRIYLVRHAEAEGNLYRRAHGHYNSLLTKNGLAQAERLGDWFSRRPVDAVYASDLHRAVRTAEAIASVCRKTVRTDPALREMALGVWEDRTWGSIVRERSNYMQWFYGTAEDWALCEAESFWAAADRFAEGLKKIAVLHEGTHIAVVAHGAVLRAFLTKTAGGSLIPHLDNASVSLVEWENGTFRASFIGENRYLGELSTHAKQSWWRKDSVFAKDEELWFSPAQLPDNLSEIMEYSRRTWAAVYGTEEGFRDEMTEKALFDSANTNPRYLQFAMEGSRRIGLLQLCDAGRLSVLDGHISLFYLEPDKRGLGLGAQLLGEAISVARNCGKTGLSLRVYHKNTSAAAFYRKMGFSMFGSENGLFGMLIQMRLPIAVP